MVMRRTLGDAVDVGADGVVQGELALLDELQDDGRPSWSW